MFKLKIIVASLVSYFLFSSCGQSFNCDDLKDNYSVLIGSLATKSDTINLVHQLRNTINENPKCIRAYHILGFLEINQMNYSVADSLFEESLKVSPTSIYSLYNLSYLHNIEGDNGQALNLINLALKEKKENAQSVDLNNFFAKEFDIEMSELLFLRGIILYDMALVENAKNDFLIVEKRKYNLNETYLYLANSYYYLKKQDSACLYAQKISKLAKETISQIIFKQCP